MYFITAMEHIDFDEDEIPIQNSTRCFGYYKDLQIAKQRVKENCCDLHECVYDYIIIEEIPEGIHAITENEWWYKYNDKLQEWEPIEKPNGSEQLINFAIG